MKKRVLSIILILGLTLIAGVVSALTVTISSPNEGQIFTNPNEDILIKASIDTEASCGVWGYVNTPNGKKDINPKQCDICAKGSTSKFSNEVNAYFDAVLGGDYEMYVTCHDKNNHSNMKKQPINFKVDGDMSSDKTPPVIIINAPADGQSQYSTFYIDFEVNELSHCSYSHTPADYNDRTSLGFSGYISNKRYENSFKSSTEYSFTLSCTDLMDNTASKTVNFKTLDKACATCLSQPNTTTPSIGMGGGGGGQGGGGQGGGCYDTDGGKNYYQKGIAAGVYDSCISKYEVSERYCEDSSGASYIYECPLGYLCEEGVCIQSTEDDREQTNVTPSTGGGSSCERYSNCSDGLQVQYCFIHKFYNENGEVVGVGCGCKSNPEILCTNPSGGSGGGGSGSQPVPINPSSGGGGGGFGSNETPIICNGCILGGKCAPIGYRQEGKYCDISSEFIPQLTPDSSCENNFECDSNLCINSQCVSGSLWVKFVRWFKSLFG